MINKNARILIVDDYFENTETMKAILEEEGYIVETANTGKEALEKTDKRIYDLALIDVRLPDIEGVQLLGLIGDPIPKMRKIIITGYPTVPNIIDSVNKRADAYLIKPVNMEEMLVLIKAQLIKVKEERRICEQKITEFIEKRMRALSQINEKESEIVCVQT